MSHTESYSTKFSRIVRQTPFQYLPDKQQTFIRKQAADHRFTLQELKKVTEIALDLNMWGEGAIIDLWPPSSTENPEGKAGKKRLLGALYTQWTLLKDQPNRYPHDPIETISTLPKAVPVARNREKLGLGRCPVASEKTRCCNLMTLDAVESCGFDCSYCSIQSFFHDNQVLFDPGFSGKLERLPIDPSRIYHIGTGQSSDSLMWGNRHGILDTLCDFAKAHPNVILEMKTKSGNVAHLLDREVPANMLCTWSLNPATIIQHEEHGTAPLERRLRAARQLADKRVVIGFHFHPMVHYAGWREEYSELFERIQSMFLPSEVAMISIGTLTFTKPVLKRIRERNSSSKILKMPLVESGGKLSYPDDVKQAMFSHTFHSFTPAWRNGVFFYLCMEKQSFWKPLFGHEYPCNEAFEAAMKQSYLEKINQRRENN